MTDTQSLAREFANGYVNPLSYFLIYVYSIDGDSAHEGILKVGDTPSFGFSSPRNCYTTWR